MKVRLTPEDQATLEVLAERYGLSADEIVARAIKTFGLLAPYKSRAGTIYAHSYYDGDMNYSKLEALFEHIPSPAPQPASQ